MLVWAPLYPAMAKFSLQIDQVPVEVRKMFGVHFVNDYSLKMHGHICWEIFPFWADVGLEARFSRYLLSTTELKTESC